jgi:predicted dehydrogenase
MKSQIRVCLVGAGRVAKVHALSLVAHVQFGKLVAIVDPDKEALENTANQFGIYDRFTSLEESLDRIDFEAVVITTPTYTHKDLAVSAAQAGKHILLEKPMALTIDECDAIIAESRKSGVILQIGFMRRFDPDFIEAAKRLESGEIGKPMIIKSLTHGPGLPPKWARDPAKSNGNIAEVNSHDWDSIRWLMGSNYESIYMQVANFKGDAQVPDKGYYYDNALVNISFENGGLGSISSVCPCNYGYDARVEIVGEKGIMQIGNLNSRALVISANRELGLITPIYRTWPERFEWGYIREMEHFITCIDKGIQPQVNGDDGRWAVIGVLTAIKSYLEDRPVSIFEIL